MDRLRKRLKDFRLQLRKSIKHNWHNDPEGDVFRSLDILFVLGAVRYKPVQKWQRICWNTYGVVSICSFLILVLNLGDQITGKFDLVKATFHATIVLGTALCFAKDSILNQHIESIQAARSFINSKPSGSGETVQDSAIRMKLFQRLQLTLLVFFVVVMVNGMIFIFPNSGINDLFGVPRILHQLGVELAGAIHFVFLLTACPIWINKYITGTATICALLYGFNREHEIFVLGFGNILDNVRSDVDEKLPSSLQAAPEWKRYRRDQLYWKYLEQRVKDQIKQHVRLVEHMQQLQPIVKRLFGIVYYHAMVGFSPLFYVLMFNRLSVTVFFLMSAVAVNLVECYAWCNIIESHQDINETLEVEIMDLVRSMPHSQLHHKEYVEMRTTLGIMKTFVRNSGQFSCFGVFPITVEAYTKLLNIGYSVLTFLRDVGKKL